MTVTGERGGATGAEMALLWGALALLLLAVVQASLLFYADQLATSAAQDGLRSGRYLSTASVTGTARRDAEDFLARTAGGALTDTSVTASVERGLLRVRVTGRAVSLVPGVPLAVEREAAGGLERPAP